jgi:predicted enzyme related to lactoylglutathione lyase
MTVAVECWVLTKMLNLTTIAYLVRDYDEAIHWFRHALQFTLIEDTDLGQGKRWVVLDAGGIHLLLAKAVGETQISHIGKAAGTRVAYFLNTNDFTRDHGRMVAAGVKFLEHPRNEPYGTVAVFEDLYGNRWDLIERR